MKNAFIFVACTLVGVGGGCSSFRSIDLWNQSFEMSTQPATGLPSRAGVWGGDATTLADERIVPAADGTWSLQFKNGYLSSPGGTSGDLWQVLPLPEDAQQHLSEGGSIDVRLIASVRRNAGANAAFSINVTTFDGQPRVRTGGGDYVNRVETGPSGPTEIEPDAWRRLDRVITLSKPASWIGVSLSARRTAGGSATFQGQFADDVVLCWRPTPSK